VALEVRVGGRAGPLRTKRGDLADVSRAGQSDGDHAPRYYAASGSH
jgi:hypothetical protein